MQWEGLFTAASKLLNALDAQAQNFLALNYFSAVDEFDRFRSGELQIGFIAGVDQYNQEGLQPLHYAIKQDKLEAISWLIREHDAPVHGKTEQELWNSAHFAVKFGKCKLLDSFNAANSAARAKNRQIPAILTDFDVQLRTPLMLALQENSKDCVRELIRLGTPLSAPVNSKGETLLHWSVRSGTEPETFEILLRAMLEAIDASSVDGLTPVALAAAQGNVALLKLLVFYGASLLSIDAQGRNILHQSNSEALKLLLNGPLPIKRFPDIFTGEPARELRNPAGKVFEEAQLAALLSAFDSNQLTPLMTAVQLSHEEMVQALASRLPRVHRDLQQMTSKNTALHLAVIGNKPNALRVVQVLLKANASVDIRNAAGKTALILAQAAGMEEVINELELFEM